MMKIRVVLCNSLGCEIDQEVTVRNEDGPDGEEVQLHEARMFASDMLSIMEPGDTIKMEWLD